MAFLNTQPFALEDPSDLVAWERFRIANPWVRLAALREILRGDTPLMVGANGLSALKATLWSVDDAAGRLQLHVQGSRSELREAVEAPLLWAACYVDSVKVQFPLRDAQVKLSHERSMISARIPEDLYRMPRRRHVRVRRQLVQAPRVVLAEGTPGSRLNAAQLQGETQLMVLDISASGCALHFPSDHPVPPEGSILRRVEVRLDEDHYLFTDMVVHNIARSARGTHRVGCSWKGMPAGAVQTLEDWLRSGHGSYQRLSLQLD